VQPGQPHSRPQDLDGWLEAVHRSFPRKPLFITEFGAESTFSGTDTQRGSFEFQSRFLREHLSILGRKRYVNAAMVWILKDFRVTPGWKGGNSTQRSTPPWNNKGLIDQTGAFKPAFYEMRRIWRSTPPLR
jgi:hypothetical protein